MLACGHDGPPCPERVCTHLRDADDKLPKFLHWYTGIERERELLCIACIQARESGERVPMVALCPSCHTKIGHLGSAEGVRGRPGFRIREEPFPVSIVEHAFPRDLGSIIDAVPIQAAPGCWLLLGEDGRLTRFDGAQSSHITLAASLRQDMGSSWRRTPRRRLHVSPRGDAAAVVVDYGRSGEVFDLRSGSMIRALDGGNYHCDTVPFSLAFVEVDGQTLLIHRSAWNRLDLVNCDSGLLLSNRSFPGKGEPGFEEHHLDYFHGALFPSPSGRKIVDDGWVWHPVGIPRAWSIDAWLGNVWESEDGPTGRDLCQREYCWDHPMTWIDESSFAVGGLGDDDILLIPGVRIFDLRLAPGMRSHPERWLEAPEVGSFVGPEGNLFSDGIHLFAAAPDGLTRWDPVDGARTGTINGFNPSRFHSGSRDFTELRQDTLVCCRLAH